MTECDALIVGGGPAGSTLARRLVDQGKKVIVLDKQTFPRDKTCAGWITPAVVEELHIDLDDYRKQNVLQPITGFITGIIHDNKTVSVHYNKPVSYGIRRCEFDDYLLQRCGAELRLGEKVKQMQRQNGQWLVNGIETPLLIGAGGHFCPVARQTGAKLGSSEKVITAKEVEFHLTDAQAATCRAQGEKPELYFCADLSGYGWVFRKGPVLNIGLGRDQNKGLTEQLQAFVDYLQASHRIPGDLPHHFKGHAYILYGHSHRPPLADGVLLIGDALGLAYPQSGEGIRPAIESALMAADVIEQVKGDYRAERLQPYARQLAQRFGDPQTQDTAAWLPPALKQMAARWLLRRRWFAQKVVLDKWFLHRHEAPLVV